MNIKRKAQTATEYLVILAVVVIIALIVVGVLGGVPGLGGSSKGNIADAYWRSSQIGVDGVNFQAGSGAANADSITIRNNNPYDIELEDITVGGTSITNSSTLNITVSAGRTDTINMTEQGVTTVNDDFGPCDTASSGDTFSTAITVTFINKDTLAQYTFTGEQNLEGECSE